MPNAPAHNITTQGFSSSAGHHLGAGVYVFQGAGNPSDGTSGTGAGWAGPGSLYINRTAGTLFQNTGTQSSPTWGTRT